MRVLLQRVKHAKCIIRDNVTGKIDKGYLLLVGFTHTDSSDNVLKMVKKITNLRVFEDESGKMNKSIKDVDGFILSISQFTLYADLSGGNRPSFTNSMKPEFANPLYHDFNNKLRENGLTVEEGIFGEDMQIELVNDGPVTISLEF